MIKFKSHTNFQREITELKMFHESSIYAFNEVEQLISFWKRNKFKFDELTEFNHIVKRPPQFGIKRAAKIKRRKNLNEIVFVRLISALEVFLVDLVRDAFLETKEPFKKQDLVFQMTHAEILSIKSTGNFYNKIINKECRKLSSSGFSEIIKYYKRHFDIDMSGYSPGKSKMEEYHDRRHLLVHRLGKTDSQYRNKYNTSKLTISIDEEYLLECIEDLKSFCNMVNNQMIYQITNQFEPIKTQHKTIDRKVIATVTFNNVKSGQEFFLPNYEFWSQDEFSVLSDILDKQVNIDSNTIEYWLSGTFAQIRSYTRIITRNSLKGDYKVELSKIKQDSTKERLFETRFLDENILKQIENCLPEQPWPTGIHKTVAEKLSVSNKLVSTGIQQLIANGRFKPQINGEIIEH